MSHLDDATAAFEAGDLGTALASLDRRHHHVTTREPTREGAAAGRELAAQIRAAARGRQAAPGAAYTAPALTETGAPLPG